MKNGTAKISIIICAIWMTTSKGGLYGLSKGQSLFRYLRRQANRLDTRFKTNEEKLIKAGGEKARELQERIEELIRLISIARDELERIESKDENDASLTEENNLHKADQKFKYYEQEIAKATRTNTALRKKELVDSLVNEIKLQATTALKQEIVRKTNEKLRRVIVDDYVEIESIDRYIKLKGRDGASEGQTLSIAYCFLGTLFEDSELEFPFIIDSPTGKMDFEKRQAVADIIPLVFNQMIAFVQSAEVERFANRFYANPDSQYLTVVASPQDQAVVVYEGTGQRLHRHRQGKHFQNSDRKNSGTGHEGLSRCLYRNSQQFWGGQMRPPKMQIQTGWSEVWELFS